jgi:hypothetical protein
MTGAYSTEGNTTRLRVIKCDGSAPSSTNVRLWATSTDVPYLSPSLLCVDAACIRTTVTWGQYDGTDTGVSYTEIPNVNIWPNRTAFLNASCGSRKGIAVYSDSPPEYTNVALWYQYQTLFFTKVCN